MVAQYRQDLSGSLPRKYAQVLAHIGAGSSVLELGCHEGDFARYLLDRGHAVKGIERDAKAATQARERGVDVRTFDLAQFEDDSWPVERFDVVLAMDVLEHLAEPERVLAAIRRNLGANGRLIVTGPNVAYWANRVSVLRGRWEYRDAGLLDRTHLRFYTFRTWMELVRTAGFAIDVALAAEGYLPIEHRLRSLPVIRAVVESANRQCLRRWPNVFGSTILLCSRPVMAENAQPVAE